jgi:outer membrane lipoprotein SlyB
MSFLSVFINRPIQTSMKRTVKGKPSVFVLDTQKSESFKGDAEVTDHPVENGSDITDHVILKSKMLQIEGTVSATPLTFGSSIAGAGTAVAASIGSAIGGILGSTGLGTVVGGVGGGLVGKSVAGLLGQQTSNRLSDIMDELVAARDSRSPVSIQTGLKLYENYILTSFEVKRDKPQGKISVTLSLKELRVVSSRSEKIKIPKVLGAIPKANDGHKNGGLTDSIKHQSILFGGDQVFNGGGVAKLLGGA